MRGFPGVIALEPLVLRDLLAAQRVPRYQVALEVLEGRAHRGAQRLAGHIDAGGVEHPGERVEIELLGIDDHAVHVEDDGLEGKGGLGHERGLLSG